MSKNPYIQFLKLSQTLTYKEIGHELDTTAIKLLEMITISYSKEESLTVSDAMSLEFMGSPATMHRKIDVLRKQGWIDLLHVGDDRRTKYLAPTKKAMKYFESLSKLMEKAWSKGQS
jgi:DNA-binding MarR family transcriptional regulator